MGFLIDTHALIWMVEGSRRLSAAARAVLEDPANDLFVSAVTAWEFADLRQRGRLPSEATFERVLDMLSPQLLDLPPICGDWQSVCRTCMAIPPIAC